MIETLQMNSLLFQRMVSLLRQYADKMEFEDEAGAEEIRNIINSFMSVDIDKLCRASWDCGSWNLTPEQLNSLDNCMGMNGQALPEDVIYVATTSGQSMTRYVASKWYDDWKSYEHGFHKAAETLLGVTR